METRCKTRAVLPLAIVVELVITSKGNQRSKAYTKGVKDLRRSSNPNLKWNVRIKTHNWRLRHERILPVSNTERRTAYAPNTKIKKSLLNILQSCIKLSSNNHVKSATLEEAGPLQEKFINILIALCVKFGRFLVSSLARWGVSSVLLVVRLVDSVH